MQVKKLILPVLMLAVCGTCVRAQTTDENQGQDQVEDSAAGQPLETGAGSSGGDEKKTTREPTLFVPRETISPDSVIAFPADI